MQTLVVGAGWVLRFQIFHPKFPLPLVETQRLCGLPDCPELLHLRSHACEQRRTCKNSSMWWLCFPVVNLVWFYQKDGGGSMIQKSGKARSQWMVAKGHKVFEQP
jgi:hypothetical protein